MYYSYSHELIAGCYMPDFCQPIRIGECDNFCPVFCPADQQWCAGPVDENGKGAII